MIAMREMMGEMIDPGDVSVATIEYLFTQQIMLLTATTAKKR